MTTVPKLFLVPRQFPAREGPTMITTTDIPTTPPILNSSTDPTSSTEHLDRRRNPKPTSPPRQLPSREGSFTTDNEPTYLTHTTACTTTHTTRPARHHHRTGRHTAQRRTACCLEFTERQTAPTPRPPHWAARTPQSLNNPRTTSRRRNRWVPPFPQTEYQAGRKTKLGRIAFLELDH